VPKFRVFLADDHAEILARVRALLSGSLTLSVQQAMDRMLWQKCGAWILMCW
jgi:hypothetical protein